MKTVTHHSLTHWFTNWPLKDCDQQYADSLCPQLGDDRPTRFTWKMALIGFWATVCKTVRSMLLDRCLSCVSVRLSATLVYCGQTVGWFKTKLGMEVCLGPGHIVLDGHPAPPKKGHISPHFSAHVLWPNGWMDQDATWNGGRPRPRPHCVRWGPSSPLAKKREHNSPQFSALVCYS